MTVPVLFLSHATPNLARSRGFAAQSLTRLGACFTETPAGDAGAVGSRFGPALTGVPITGVVVVSSRWTSNRMACVSASPQHSPIDDEDALAAAALAGLREALAKSPHPYRGEERRRPDPLRDARGSGWGRRAADRGLDRDWASTAPAASVGDRQSAPHNAQHRPEALAGERLEERGDARSGFVGGAAGTTPGGPLGRVDSLFQEPIRVYAPPGDAHLAQIAADLLNRAGFGGRLDPMRGLDHGVWAPLTHLFAHACVPLAQVSIPEQADVQAAFELGRALAPLREKGVLLVGSGQYPRVPEEEIGNVMESALADSFAWPVPPSTEALRDGFCAMDLPQLALRAWTMETLLGSNPLHALDYRGSAPPWVQPDEEAAAHLRPLWVMMGAARLHREVPFWLDAGVFEGCFVDSLAWGLDSETTQALSEWRRAQAHAWMHAKERAP